jgi:putative addiction module component (TIGR02574 family)
MSATLKSFGLDRLTADERLTLLGELWDSLADDPGQVPVTDAQKHDLRRRLAALDADPTAGSPWEDVKARLLGGR